MGVYRVAVCDDERAACEEVCRLCDDILTQDGVPHRIVPFSSASALDACLREGDDAFDLLVLDIAMQGQSGMELAHELRRRRDRVSTCSSPAARNTSRRVTACSRCTSS